MFRVRVWVRVRVGVAEPLPERGVAAVDLHCLQQQAHRAAGLAWRGGEGGSCDVGGRLMGQLWPRCLGWDLGQGRLGGWSGWAARLGQPRGARGS